MAPLLLEEGGLNDAAKAAARKARLVGELGPEGRLRAESLLVFLFPTVLRSVRPGTGLSDRDERNLRLRCSGVLSRFLALGTGAPQVSSVAVHNLIQIPERRAEILEAILSSAAPIEWFHHAMNFVPHLEIPEPEHLIEALGEALTPGKIADDRFKLEIVTFAEVKS